MMAKRRLTSGITCKIRLLLSTVCAIAIQSIVSHCNAEIQEWILFLFLLAILRSLHSVDR